jgi:hypothetical protein
MSHALVTLIDEVLKDAEVHDVEVSIQVDTGSKTMGASYKDDVGMCRYYVNDIDALWYEIQKELEGEQTSMIDAFWSILNTVYKI